MPGRNTLQGTQPVYVMCLAFNRRLLHAEHPLGSPRTGDQVPISGFYFKPKTEEFSKLRVSMIIAFRGIRISVMLLSALCGRRFHLPFVIRR
jgi:hypothetical protein